MQRRTEKVILLYQNRGEYFFSGCTDIAKPVLSDNPIASRLFPFFRKLRSRILTRMCYGSWTRDVSSADLVIILDSAYDWQLPQTIKEVSPKAKLLLLFWNPIGEKQKRIMQHFQKYGIIAAYNYDESVCYECLFVPAFYSAEYAARFKGEDAGIGVLFLGRDKGRSAQLSEMATALSNAGIPNFFMLAEDGESEQKANLIYHPSGMEYSEYCQYAARAIALFDLSQSGVCALNLRVMESLFFQRKLITTNPEIAKCDFYNPRNVLIVRDADELASRVVDFLNEPFELYGSDILEKYDVRSVVEDLRRQIEIEQGSKTD